MWRITLQSSQESNVNSARHATRGDLLKWSLAATAALLALACNTGCMVEAMYAVPVALEGAATSIARALPVDEPRYIVHTPRIPSREPALAKAQANTSPSTPQPAPAPALADAAKSATSHGQAPAPTASPAASATPMPILLDNAIVRRTRL